MEATRKGAVLIGGSPGGLIGSDCYFGYVYQYNFSQRSPIRGGVEASLVGEEVFRYIEAFSQYQMLVYSKDTRKDRIVDDLIAGNSPPLTRVPPRQVRI